MVYKIIRYFHINSKYKGYPLIVDAINFYVENYGQSIKITKDIYPLLSKKYNIPISCVERNIRTVVGFYTPVRTYSKERKAEFEMRRWADINAEAERV